MNTQNTFWCNVLIEYTGMCLPIGRKQWGKEASVQTVENSLNLWTITQHYPPKELLNFKQLHGPLSKCLFSTN